jgi:dedicated sortase system histidine kinase
MEGALQSGQEQALLATTRAVATVLGDKPELLYPNAARREDDDDTGRQLYAITGTAPVIVDGYADGWAEAVHGSYGAVRYRAQARGALLYLLIEVADNDVVYHDPRQTRAASGDRLILKTGQARYVIATGAPGPVQARIERNGSMGWEPRIRGQWQDSLEGFTIELEIPLALLRGRLGFYVIDDSGQADTEAASWTGNINPGEKAPWLVYPPGPLQALLAPFASSGLRLQVVDRHDWIIGSAGNTEQDKEIQQESPWLLRALYRAILNGTPLPEAKPAKQFGQYRGAETSSAIAGNAAAGWYAAPDEPALKMLTAAAPVFSGGEVAAVVVADQNSEQYLSLTDQAFNRLLYYSLTALLVSALGLLGYASWLSWRIRRLSRASVDIIRPDGGLRDNFPVSNSSDEIGELSRQYGQLLDRLRDYTDYLRTLSRKLSHELRTPIAVIQSSLDNLEAEPADADVYVQRAREGLGRLGNILTAMSEASRLEESVHSNPRETFDLVSLCRDLFAAYEGLYTGHRLNFNCEPEQWPMDGVPDLIAQMLDKLMDNAVSFTPDGGLIVLVLRECEAGLELSVSNEGPLLPEAMQRQLFDSMVSVRDKSDRVHLGLGLHIVRLIVDFHDADVRGENLEDGSGVCFAVTFPRGDQPRA